MSERGLCSRREADSLIEKALVKVNGEVVSELGFKTTEAANIELLNEAQESLNTKITIALNKPRDYVSSQPEKNYRSALELVVPKNYWGKKKCPPYIKKGLAPMGRLDIDSTGLILYSQKGTLAKSIIGENSSIEKEYEVNVLGGITQEKLERLRFGLTLDGVKLKRATITQVTNTKMIFILKQGRKRQIRRMCELVDLRVTRIHRTRVGKYKIGDLPEGNWTFVTESEIL